MPIVHSKSIWYRPFSRRNEEKQHMICAAFVAAFVDRILTVAHQEIFFLTFLCPEWARRVVAAADVSPGRRRHQIL